MNHEQLVYLVTGATSGIGMATAIGLAGRDARVLLGARTEHSGQDAAERIRAQVPEADLTVVAGDLADMRQVRALAGQVRQATTRLDGLILNAAEVRTGRTPEGLSVMYATNYLAGFLLTDLLLGLLRDSAPARVIALSSSMHARVKPLDLAALPTIDHYETTKLLNVLFVAELARRTDGSRITANTADPGFVATNLGRHATGAFRLFLTLSRPFQAAPDNAARTPIFLATAPQAAATTGGYYRSCKPRQPSALAQDPALARELWEQTTALLAEIKSR